MAWQLIYTSTPRGLVAGRSGFCTVARHRDLRDRLVAEIERLSAYDKVTHPQLSGAPGPVVAAHRILEIAGTRYHLLSCTQNAGLDYTGRSSYIAHHLVLDATEINRLPSPAAILRLFDWKKRWEGEPRYLTTDDTPNLATLGTPLKLPATNWERVTGQAINATLLAERYSVGGCNILTKPGSEKDLLPLYEEALLVLDQGGTTPSRLWQVRFTTFLQASERPADFDWRGGWTGRPPATSTETGRSLVLDLTQPQTFPRPQSPVMAQVAAGGAKAIATSTPKAVERTASQPTIRGAIPISSLSAPPPSETTVPSRPIEPEKPRRKKTGPFIVLGILAVLLILGGLALWFISTQRQSAARSAQLLQLTTAVAEIKNKHDADNNQQLPPAIVDALKSIKAFQDSQPTPPSEIQVTLSNINQATADFEAATRQMGGCKTKIDGLLKLMERVKTPINESQLNELQQQYLEIKNIYTAATQQKEKANEQFNESYEAFQKQKNPQPPLPDTTTKPAQPSPDKQPPHPDKTVEKPAQPVKPSISPASRGIYVIKAALSESVPLKSLLEAHGIWLKGTETLTTKNLNVKFIENPPSYETTATGGTLLKPGPSDDGIIRFKKKVMDEASWATIDRKTGLFKCTDETPKAIAVVFEKDGEALDVLILSEKLPPLSRHTSCIDRKELKKIFKNDCLPKICTASQSTRYRLTTAKFREISEKPGQHPPAPSVLEVDQNFTTTKGEAAIDWTPLKNAVETKIAQLGAADKQHREGRESQPTEIPIIYTPYLNQLHDTGKDLLRLGEPRPEYEHLKDFASYLKSSTGRITNDPWADCLQYLRALYAILDKQIEKSYEKWKQNADNMPDRNEQERKAKNAAQNRVVQEFGSNYREIPALFSVALTDWKKLDGVANCLKIMAKNASEPVTELTDFSQNWPDIWKKLEPVVKNERAQFASIKETNAKQEQKCQDEIKKWGETLTQISDAINNPGTITLEIEVTPGNWWPLIQFTDK